MLSQKKSNCYFLTHYIWKMSPHYLVKIAQILHLFRFFHVYRVPIRNMDELRNGSVLLRHGLNFSTAWWMIQLISGKKTGSMYPCRRWSLWTFAVTLLACCHLPHITTSSFQSYQCQPTTGSFQIHQRLEKRTYLQSDEKGFMHFTK